MHNQIVAMFSGLVVVLMFGGPFFLARELGKTKKDLSLWIGAFLYALGTALMAVVYTKNPDFLIYLIFFLACPLTWGIKTLWRALRA